MIGFPSGAARIDKELAQFERMITSLEQGTIEAREQVVKIEQTILRWSERVERVLEYIKAKLDAYQAARAAERLVIEQKMKQAQALKARLAKAIEA
jgi:hypothetical protein